MTVIRRVAGPAGRCVVPGVQTGMAGACPRIRDYSLGRLNRRPLAWRELIAWKFDFAGLKAIRWIARRIASGFPDHTAEVDAAFRPCEPR